MALSVSPVLKRLNCQKVSPGHTRLRPCVPCCTVFATRSACAINAGRVAPSVWARASVEACVGVGEEMGIDRLTQSLCEAVNDTGG